MHFADQCAVLALIILLLGWSEFGHHHLLGILSDLKHCFLSHYIYIFICNASTFTKLLGYSK